MLTAEPLQTLAKEEREKAEAFEALPRRFFEVSKVLLDVAADDLTQPGTLRSLLKDIRDMRQAKIRQGLQSEGVMRGSYLQVSRLRLLTVLSDGVLLHARLPDHKECVLTPGHKSHADGAVRA